MSLPGKLCIGILEEDNPLRSYFRFKPLLVDDNGRYVVYGDAPAYPDEGCIRIVPDKNESYHFKARMRRIGLFCVVDLRAHPGDSDKIRPNKNYRPESGEINASIIYSDVVRAPAPDMIYEILPESAADAPAPAPHTPDVLLRRADGVGPVRYGWTPIEDADGAVRLTASEETCPLDAMQVFELPGFGDAPLAFAIKPAALMDRVSDADEKPAARQEKAEKAEEPPRAAEAAPASEAPARPTPPPEEPPREAAPAPESPEPAQKPWLHHDDSMLPPPVNRHLSRAEQLMAAQAGLNPRRGRSLSELIDEKWQRSRLNQLGQPVAPIATGAPVQSPVDAAVSAVRAAWSQPQLRAPLMNALSDVGDFTQSLEACRKSRRQTALEEQLNALEAQRLELMGELDRLKAGNQTVREQLKREILREEAGALADAVRKTEDARAEQARCEQLAADARATARDAQGLLDELAGDQLERKIRDVALTRRVEERLDLLRGGPEAAALPPEAERIGIETLIDRVTRRFEAEGWALSRPEAANLCVCFALSPLTMLSGTPGSGKTTAARLLADALGLTAAGRAASFAPGPRPLADDPRIARLNHFKASPAAILLDDINLFPAPDPLRGLAQGLSPEWRVLATVQDAHTGLPLRAGTLDKGFLIRLSSPAALPWRPAARQSVEPFPLASIAGVLETLPQAEVPIVMIEGMEALRRAMAENGTLLSRRALDDAWRYCAAMLAILGDEARPDAVLDMAVAQRLLPALLAGAPVDSVLRLRECTESMPACRALLAQPLPIQI